MVAKHGVGERLVIWGQEARRPYPDRVHQFGQGPSTSSPWGSRSTSISFGAIRDCCGLIIIIIIIIYICMYMYIYKYTYIHMSHIVYIIHILYIYSYVRIIHHNKQELWHLGAKWLPLSPAPVLPGLQRTDCRFSARQSQHSRDRGSWRDPQKGGPRSFGDLQNLVMTFTVCHGKIHHAIKR